MSDVSTATQGGTIQPPKQPGTGTAPVPGTSAPGETPPEADSPASPPRDSAPTTGGASSTLTLPPEASSPPNFGSVDLQRLGEVPLGTSTTGDPPVNSTPPAPEPSPPPPPSVPPPPPKPPKVFIVGNLRKFGGKYVKVGLKAMLAAAEGKKTKGKTHNTLSKEDAETLRAILNSKDPAVQQLLDSKIPKKKSFVIDENGKLLDTIDTKTQVMANKTLQMEKHGMFWERSAGGELDLNGQKLQVAGTELHSPIKIALDGVNASLNSTNQFKIDLDGFSQGQEAVRTSGGLNQNEAWLVRDKDGDGIMRNGVVDGRDVYGDHFGKFGNGYEELAKDFASEVRTDPATGKRYIDLSDPDSRAAQQLKLLDVNGNLVPAGKVLTRIDVDFKDVMEADKTGQNQIRQRGEVTYKDGHTATSADQWYSTTK
jgi:hypothetical protein